MELLPVEIINEITLLVDGPSLYDTSRVCKQWYRLSLKRVKKLNNLEAFVEACLKGDLLSITQCTLNQNWINEGFRKGCKAGHKRIVEYSLLTVPTNGMMVFV